MKRQPIKSRNLAEVGFEANTLEILFHSGKVYRYKGVAESVYAKLLTAESAGKFFAEHIMPNYTGKLVK